MRRLEVAGRFGPSQRRLAPGGSPEWTAVERVLAQLADDRLPLPGADDVRDLIPPSLPCMARAIPSVRLRVCYAVRGDVVFVLAIKPSA